MSYGRRILQLNPISGTFLRILMLRQKYRYPVSRCSSTTCFCESDGHTIDLLLHFCRLVMEETKCIFSSKHSHIFLCLSPGIKRKALSVSSSSFQNDFHKILFFSFLFSLFSFFMKFASDSRNVVVAVVAVAAEFVAG